MARPAILASPSQALGSWVGGSSEAAWIAIRGSRRKSAALSEPGIMPMTTSPSPKFDLDATEPWRPVGAKGGKGLVTPEVKYLAHPLGECRFGGGEVGPAARWRV